jgi:hypothetical protein
MEYPRIRRLEAFPVNQQGKEMVALRDPEGYFRDLAVLPPPIFFIASLCDGTRSVRDLQTAYVRRYGDLITSDQIAEVIRKLDEQLLLDSPRFRLIKKQYDREYMNLPNRPMILAGRSYHPNPQVLARQISSLLGQAEGQNRDDDLPLGLISPHIDLERGARCYAETYAYLSRSLPPGKKPLVVILGTCHGEMEGYFALTSKNYLTPFGLVETDAGTARELAEAAGWEGLGDELSHRNEHSIEIQLPFLVMVMGGPDNFKILPVTCNSFQPFIQQGNSPGNDETVARFVSALRGLKIAFEDEVMILAAADLAHVGTRFGSPLPTDAVILSSVSAKDREMLDLATGGNGEGFYSYIMREGDNRHVCGLPPIYTLLKVLDGRAGKLLSYEYWFDPREGSAVTFAGVTFPR